MSDVIELPFAGLSPADGAELPDWIANGINWDHVPEAYQDFTPTFAEVIDNLPTADTTQVAYRNPHSDEWVPTDRHTAVVDPERLLRQSQEDEDWGDVDESGAGGLQPLYPPGEDDTPLWHIPTDTYTIIPPRKAYKPLMDIAGEQGHGAALCGVAKVYRRGGKVDMDIGIDTKEVNFPGMDPVKLGVETGYDFFGNRALYATAWAQDTNCSNSMRNLTKKAIRKHVGDVSGLREWWLEVWEKVDTVADMLHQLVHEASDTDVDFSELPYDLSDFYQFLGFPEYLAEAAEMDARDNSDDSPVYSMWRIYSGATYALSFRFRGESGSRLDDLYRSANDILYNPHATLEHVDDEYERQRADQDISEWTNTDPVARISDQVETTESRVQELEDREERIRSLFRDATADLEE